MISDNADLYEELVQLQRDNRERSVNDLARAFVEHHPEYTFDDAGILLLEARSRPDVVHRYLYRVVVHCVLFNADVAFDIRAPDEPSAINFAVSLAKLQPVDLAEGRWTVRIANPNRRPSRVPLESPPQGMTNHR